MTSTPSAKSEPASQPAEQPTAHVHTFEVTMREFWEKNRSAIVVLCVAILAGIVIREGWQLFSASRERGVQDEFAAAGTDAAKLDRFAAEHSGHALAGAALLLIADQRYESGDFSAAAAAYDKAAGALELDALLGRAKLGAAISKAAAGDRAAGESALKAVQGDAALPRSIRSEAAYHLASLAAEAGNKDEALKQIEEISKIDPAGAWAQRAVSLRANLELGAKPAAADGSAAGITFKPGS